MTATEAVHFMQTTGRPVRHFSLIYPIGGNFSLQFFRVFSDGAVHCMQHEGPCIARVVCRYRSNQDFIDGHPESHYSFEDSSNTTYEKLILR